jgi:hypothetical protein
MLLKGSVIKFNTATKIISKIKIFVEFLTIKSCSNFRNILARKGGIIIKIVIRYKRRLFKAKKLKKMDKLMPINIKNEPIILKIASFLPRTLISYTKFTVDMKLFLSILFQ